MENNHCTYYKSIYNVFLQYIEKDIDYGIEDQLETFQKFFSEIKKEKHEIKPILHFISNIASNHHRSNCFSRKIEKILLIMKEYIKKNFLNFEIFEIFHENKQILLFLIEDHILSIDSLISLTMDYDQYKNYSYSEYFSPEIERSDPNAKKTDRSKYPDFELKRQIGENDSYICELIRRNDFSEFESKTNIRNFDFNAKIEPSVFETNPFLINNSPSLIQYAAFHGSIDIFQFLLNKGARIDSSIWKYAIHGQNEEIIEFLRQNSIDPEDKTYEECLEESIKCHHNEITEYIKEHFIKNKDDSSNIHLYSFRYHNYAYMPSDFNDHRIYRYLCEYDYYNLLEHCLRTKRFDVGPLIEYALKNDKDEFIDLLTPYSTQTTDEVVREIHTENNNNIKIFSLWKQDNCGNVVITEAAQEIISSSKFPCIVLLFGNIKVGKSTIVSNIMAGQNSYIKKHFLQTAPGIDACTRNTSAIGPIKCRKLAAQFGIQIADQGNENLDRDIFVVDTEGLNPCMQTETVWLKNALKAMLPVSTVSFYVSKDLNAMELEQFKKYLTIAPSIGLMRFQHGFGYIINRLDFGKMKDLPRVISQRNNKHTNKLLEKFKTMGINFDNSQFQSFCVVSSDHHCDEYFNSLREVAHFIVNTCMNEKTILSGQMIIDIFNKYMEQLNDDVELSDPKATFNEILINILNNEIKKSIQELMPIIEQEISNKLGYFWFIKFKNIDVFLKDLFENGIIDKIISHINKRMKPFISDSFLENKKFSLEETEKLIKEVAQLVYNKELNKHNKFKENGDILYYIYEKIKNISPVFNNFLHL